MQAINVTRHSKITQQLVPSSTALSFICCSQFACKKKLLMTFGTSLVYPSKFHRHLRWVQQFIRNSRYIPRKIKTGQTRNGKKLLCVRWRPIRLAALLNGFTKLTREDKSVPEINERENLFVNGRDCWHLRHWAEMARSSVQYCCFVFQLTTWSTQHILGKEMFELLYFFPNSWRCVLAAPIFLCMWSSVWLR